MQRFLSGFWDGIKGQIYGIWELLTDTGKIIKAIYDLIAALITNREATVKAIWAEIGEFSEDILFGDGYTLGKTIGEMAGPAAVKKIVDGLAKGGKLAQIAKRIETGCSSFTAGTLVWTELGLRPIEEIKVGDLVWSRSDAAFEDALKRVTALHHRIAEEYYVVNAGSVILEVTAEHPLWLQGGGWTPAKELNAYQVLAAAKGDLLVRRTRYMKGPVSVYNFSVEDLHSYFVASHKLWVHNANGDCRLGPPNLRKPQGLDAITDHRLDAAVARLEIQQYLSSK